jgi:hypothetical protein
MKNILEAFLVGGWNEEILNGNVPNRNFLSKGKKGRKKR